MSERTVKSGLMRTAVKLLLTGVVIPGLLLLGCEFMAGYLGYGYPSTLFVRETAGDGNQLLRTNYQVGYRFFPGRIARKPLPELMPADKPEDRLRIFVLGESAARGEQLADFSFARMLEVVLNNGGPQKVAEVINTGIPAINSWVLRDFAREIVGYQPDLIIVFAGHNEFIGPYGPASVTGASSSRMAALVGIWASSLRMVQALKTLTLPAGLAQGWRGLEMFIKNSIKADSEAFRICLENWKANIGDIFSTAASAGVPVIWCRVPVNHRDCPPFMSDETAITAEIREAIASVSAAAEKADYQAVIDGIGGLRGRVKNYALLDYLEGTALLGLGQTKTAGQAFKNAINNDCFRVRTSDSFNDAAQEQAKLYGAVTADVEAGFTSASSNGIIGGDLVYDHVHLTLQGHYLAAATIFATIKSMNTAFSSKLPEKFPGFEEIKSMTGFTGQDEADNLNHIISSLQSPPFTMQFMHQQRLARLTDELRNLRQSNNHEANIAITRAAIARWPFCAALYHRMAMLDQQKPEMAQMSFEFSLRLNPYSIDTLNNYGLLLYSRGNNKEAEKRFQQAIALAPDFARAHFNLGILYSEGKRAGEESWKQKAIEHYQQAVISDPGMTNAWRNLANLHFKNRRFAEALQVYQQAARTGAADELLTIGAGNCLMELQRHDEAIAAYQQAIASFPASPSAHYSLGMAMTKLQKPEEAWRSFLTAAESGHLMGYYRIFELHFSGGHTLSDSQLANLSKKACELSEFKDPWLLQIMAAGYLSSGQKNEAAGILHSALKLAREQNNHELAAEIEANIRLADEQ